MKRTFWLPLGVGLLLVAAGLGGCVRERPNPAPSAPKVSYAPTVTRSTTVIAPQVTASPQVTTTVEGEGADQTPPPEGEVAEEPSGALVETPAPSSPGGGEEVTGTGSSYQVRWGDTLSGIARRFGTTIDAIIASNPQITDRNRVNAGTVLTIPGASTETGGPTAPEGSTVARETGEYVVQRGDTLSGIARRFGTTIADLMQANPWITNMNYVEAGRSVVIPVGGDYTAPGVHVVSAGETLSAIARRYNTTIWAIVMRNNLSDVNHIYVGQKLIIP